MSKPYLRQAALAATLIATLALAACGSGAATDGTAGPTRTVEHAMGTTEVPADPQRVVVLDTGELDTVLALGVTPVGAVSGTDGAPLPSYLGDRVAGIEVIGTPPAPNLEALAALEPDLILSSKLRSEELYPRLSEIAPTVLSERYGATWRENIELAGAALAREAQAAQVLTDYRAKAEEIGLRFGDPARTTVSMIRFLGGGVRLYGTDSFIGTILADIGFDRPPGQQVDTTFTEVSAEQLRTADGDLLFYSAFGPDGEAGQVQAVAGPLWPGIPAVAQGRAHEVSDDLWYLGIGPIAADLVLDDITAFAPA